ncbi:hypothetical protein [Vallitalea guaymasensis]|uniref:hypothetical protein n=1 Tax=Vallitalea guaymasensis TaxID=1185412 RepID=UPI002354C3FD|nr:hypothetical protein [Vallitalea guaymasensis]
MTDNDVLHNFRDILCKIYQNLIKVEAHSYDDWDQIVENLYSITVMKTFFYKYYDSESLRFEDIGFMKYDIAFLRDASQSYIKVVPIKDNIRIYDIGYENIVDSRIYRDSILVFKAFGDSINILTGGISKKDAESVHFNYTEVVAHTDGFEESDKFLFLNTDDIKFEFVKGIG